MKIITTASFEDGRPIQVVLDWSAFQTAELPGFGRNERRAVEVDGRYYLLAHDCPNDGLGVWTAAGSPEEAAKDAAIIAARAALDPEQLAAVGLAGVKTRAEKIAQKIADDAAEAARVEEAAAKAAAEAARNEEAAARAAARAEAEARAAAEAAAEAAKARP